MTLSDIVRDPIISTPAHAVAPVAVLGTIVGYLPAVAALMAVIWYCLLIYDWVEKRWRKRKK